LLPFAGCVRQLVCCHPVVCFFERFANRRASAPAGILRSDESTKALEAAKPITAKKFLEPEELGALKDGENLNLRRFEAAIGEAFEEADDRVTAD